MTETALIAGRRGSVADWLSDVVTATGADVAATLTVDAPEDNEYHLPEGLVRDVVTTVEEEGCTRVVVDGHLHPGQFVDLRERLPDVTLRDRRRVVYERLAPENPVASVRADLEAARVARRTAERDQRTGQTQSPEGTSGRVADLDDRCTRLRDSLAERTADARDRIESAYTDVDAHCVVLRRLGVSSPLSRHLFVAEDTAAEPPAGLEPVRPETARAALGPHDAAVTDVPGIPWTGGIPGWFEDVVPGTVAALDRADIVVGAATADGLVEHAASRFDAEAVTVDPGDPVAAEAAVEDALPTVDLAVALPYSDDAQALVSWLYDRATVEDARYRDRIEVAMTVSAAGQAAVERRVESVDGRVKVMSDDEAGHE